MASLLSSGEPGLWPRNPGYFSPKSWPECRSRHTENTLLPAWPPNPFQVSDVDCIQLHRQRWFHIGHHRQRLCHPSWGHSRSTSGYSINTGYPPESLCEIGGDDLYCVRRHISYFVPPDASGDGTALGRNALDRIEINDSSWLATRQQILEGCDETGKGRVAGQL